MKKITDAFISENKTAKIPSLEDKDFDPFFWNELQKLEAESETESEASPLLTLQNEVFDNFDDENYNLVKENFKRFEPTELEVTELLLTHQIDKFLAKIDIICNKLKDDFIVEKSKPLDLREKSIETRFNKLVSNENYAYLRFLKRDTICSKLDINAYTYKNITQYCNASEYYIPVEIKVIINAIKESLEFTAGIVSADESAEKKKIKKFLLLINKNKLIYDILKVYFNKRAELCKEFEFGEQLFAYTKSSFFSKEKINSSRFFQKPSLNKNNRQNKDNLPKQST